MAREKLIRVRRGDYEDWRTSTADWDAHEIGRNTDEKSIELCDIDGTTQTSVFTRFRSAQPGLSAVRMVDSTGAHAAFGSVPYHQGTYEGSIDSSTDIVSVSDSPFEDDDLVAVRLGTTTTVFVYVINSSSGAFQVAGAPGGTATNIPETGERDVYPACLLTFTPATKSYLFDGGKNVYAVQVKDGGSSSHAVTIIDTGGFENCRVVLFTEVSQLGGNLTISDTSGLRNAKDIEFNNVCDGGVFTFTDKHGLWSCERFYLNAPTSTGSISFHRVPKLTDLTISGMQLDISDILILLDEEGNSAGEVVLTEAHDALTSAAQTAYDNLIGKGWTLTGVTRGA